MVWDGRLKLLRNRLRSFQTINFHNLEKSCKQKGNTELVCESITTGGVSGLIVELEKPASGELHIETVQKRFKVSLGKLGLQGRSYELGGIGKRISAYRLPSKNGSRSVSFQFTPKIKDLNRGDNPLYVCVVQEDGHMAWSSPIYVVKN